MNKVAIYSWQTAYVSAILEFEPKRYRQRSKSGSLIHDRMKDPIQSAARNTRQFRMPSEQSAFSPLELPICA